MKDKWRNKDVLFYSYIVAWMIILSLDLVENETALFVGGLVILLILRLTVLKNWWDKPLIKEVDKIDD